MQTSDHKPIDYTFTGDTNMECTARTTSSASQQTEHVSRQFLGFNTIKAVSTGTYALWASTGYLVAFSSSERYKENIQDMREEWKDHNLSTRTFDWKEDGSVEIDPNRGKADQDSSPKKCRTSSKLSPTTRSTTKIPNPNIRFKQSATEN